MSGGLDFRVEIIKGRPQGMSGIQIVDTGIAEIEFSLAMDTPGEVVDITSHVELDGLGSINRAMERDLLSFKTGDVTLKLDNPGGYFDDLFAFFTAKTMWGLRILRRGEVQFYGCLIGPGSIAFDRKDRSVEITAYGLIKLVDLSDAGLVRRAFPAPYAVTTAIATQTNMTLTPSVSPPVLLTNDVLHPTDHVNSEDVTVKQVTSATVVELTAALAHTYAAGSLVEVKTKFYRFKTIDFLVRKLFKAAFIAVSDLRLNGSQFSRCAPTPVNIEGLNITADARRGMSAMVGGNAGLWNAAIHAVDSYSQASPDGAWIVQGLTDRGVYDWSPFYAQGNAGPAYEMFEPVVGATQEVGAGARFATYWGAVDYYSATKRVWCIEIGISPSRFIERTTVDGVTYAAPTNVALPAGTNNSSERGLEYDPVRNFVHCSWRNGGGGTDRYFQYRDLSGAAWVDCKQAGDAATTGYYGPRYIADLDYTLVLKNATASSTGPDFTICAFRGASLLWERPFPSCLIAQDVAGNPYFYPTRTARFINGSIYITLIADGTVKLMRTDDEFQTYEMNSLVPDTTNTKIMACRIADTYRIFCYRGTSPLGYFIAAPFYAGVIDYADFDGLSAAEALKKLSVLANALFWVDDDLQGHFVARDLFEPSDVLDITDRVMERNDTLVWEETAQYATMTGNGVTATAGDPAFAAEGITLDSSLIPNEAYAQASADDYYGFYSVKRAAIEATVLDPDGHIYRPLDRVVIDGLRYLVYESDHDLTADEVSLTLLEDV